jgi:hypothetical protein
MRPGAAISGAIVKLFAETEQVAIRRFEEAGSGELVVHLTPAVLQLLDRAGTVLGILLARYESEGDDPFGEMFSEQEIVPLRLVPNHPPPRSPGAAIGDLAFVAIAELRQHQHRLQGHRATQDAQDIISDCGSALRAIRKSLYALEPLLCEVEQTPQLLPPRLGTSLQVRRQYHKLWSFAATIAPVDASTVRAALRGAGTRIAILVGSQVHQLLREDDRFRLRELQCRILEWLRDGDETEPTGESAVAAVRLWQDFALFVEMLRQVNLREELIEHDREVLRDAVAALRSGGEAVVNAVVAALAAIHGVDDALDELLKRGPSAPVLLRELTRVRAQLKDPQELTARASAPVAR